MKTLRKIIALAVVAFNMACESDDILDKPTVPPSGELKKVSVTANLTPEIEEYSDGTMVYIWKGKATSNLVSKVNLSLLTNIAYDPENTQGFYPLEGSFNLWSDDYQHTVVGSCTGNSFITHGKFVIQGDITMQSGTGKFAHESATISFFVLEFFPFPNIKNNNVHITGMLSVPK